MSQTFDAPEEQTAAPIPDSPEDTPADEVVDSRDGRADVITAIFTVVMFAIAAFCFVYF